ncbi:2356_t:CDS:2 [Cetraspora pellucida]|uniref:2356_t:CDS:1 n=1 Tax=Cetraspora pellucida TaxID=1433469 RepID=A0ACA9KS92_9GLOM|nr:2356_t:CDS:2 [Cetraspora pellucida]
MVYICICPECNGKKVDRRTWNNHFDFYMSDNPAPTTSKFSEDITNKSCELFLEDFQQDPPIVLDNIETSLGSSFISENIEILQPDSTSIFEYTEQDQNFDLNFNNCTKGSSHRKINKFVDNIDLTQLGLSNNIIIESDEDKDCISIEYDDENTEYKTNLLATNFPIHIELDPNDTSCLLLTAPIIIQWIVLWILLFKRMITLAKISTEILFNFLYCILNYIDSNYFTAFPKSNYRVSKLFGLDQDFIKFYICPNCHKLFWTQEYVNEFCQSSCTCGAELKKPVCTSKGKILHKPIKIYPYNSIISHLKKILLLPEIEEALESCYKHSLLPNNLLSDVYDVGLIPGPHEPSVTENSNYIEPIVYELDKLWNGVIIKTSKYPNGRLFRDALILIACDTPAARKISGFAGHSFKNRCYKCTKKFPTFLSNHSKSGKINFSGFNQEYSLIDPMHNLYLETAQYITKLWTTIKINNKPLISKKDLEIIQNIINCNPSPYDITNWVLVYSTLAIRNLLPENHRKYWQDFVCANALWAQKVINISEIEKAHEFIYQFCIAIEKIFGVEFITLNMHMHIHLKECLLDYGPVYEIWCFAYERMNDKLLVIPTSNRDITIEVMAVIYEEITINIVASTLLKKFSDSINCLFKIFYNSISLEGTLAKYLIPVQDVLNLYNISTKILEQNITGAESFSGKFLKPTYFSHLDNITNQYLAQFYNKIYTKNQQTLPFTASCDYISSSNSIFVLSAIERAGIICIGDEKFGSISS